jgi:hypothetical protein
MSEARAYQRERPRSLITLDAALASHSRTLPPTLAHAGPTLDWGPLSRGNSPWRENSCARRQSAHTTAHLAPTRPRPAPRAARRASPAAPSPRPVLSEKRSLPIDATVDRSWENTLFSLHERQRHEPIRKKRSKQRTTTGSASRLTLAQRIREQRSAEGPKQQIGKPAGRESLCPRYVRHVAGAAGRARTLPHACLAELACIAG